MNQLNKSLEVNQVVAISTSIFFVWYLCIDTVSFWSIIRPLLAVIIFALAVFGFFSVFDKDVRSSNKGIAGLAILLFFLVPSLLFKIMYQPGNFIIQSFDLDQRIEYFGRDYSFGYKLWCILFYIMFIAINIISAISAPRTIFLGIVVALILLVSSLIYSELSGSQIYIDEFLDGYTKKDAIIQ